MVSSTQQRVLIIDGDPYAFKAALANEFSIDDGDGWIMAACHIDQAVARTVHELKQLAEQFSAQIVFCWSGLQNPCFRHQLGEYKAKRKTAVRPLGIQEIKTALAAHFESYWLPNIEADDVIGILATDPTFKPGCEKVIVSIDKDLKTIPGLFFNPDKMDAPEHRTQQQADLFFYAQAIAGDIADGYTGAPGFGMQTAEKLLKAGHAVETYTHTLTRGVRKGQQEERRREVPAANHWETVVSCYEAAGLNEEDALLNARMARILTADLWNASSQQPVLWRPDLAMLNSTQPKAEPQAQTQG